MNAALDIAEAAFDLATRYPPTVAGQSNRRDAQAAVWAGRVWGQAEGWACVGVGHGGHIPPGGKYQFVRMEHRFYRWPNDLRRFLSETMVVSEDTDVYIIPALRQSRSARKGAALGGQVAWADVDTEWTLELDEQARRLGAWQVASGSGGRHLYLQLTGFEPPDRLEVWNRRLGTLFGADSKWAENALLRLPGTFNHKPRAKGGQSVPVRWL